LKGIIFNLVEDAVCEQYGERVWDDLLTTAGLAGGYTSLGIYPDEDLGALVQAASAALDRPHDDVLRALGHGAALGLARQYPQFFEPHSRTADFVKTLNDVIHPEVRKIKPDADPPEFVITDAGGAFLVEYHSRRELCALAHGMLVGAAEYYGEECEVVHDSCTHRGDAVCVMRCHFVPLGGR